MLVQSRYCNLAYLGRGSPWPYTPQYIVALNLALPGSLHSGRVIRIHDTCRMLYKAHNRKAKQARVSATDLDQELQTASDPGFVQEAEPYITHCWTWGDHRINYAASLECFVMRTYRTDELLSCCTWTRKLIGQH